MPGIHMPHLGAAWWRVAGIVMIAGLAGVGGWFLYNSPALSIRSIEVDGASTLSDETVRDVAGLKGDSVFSADFEGARERLLALPLVKEAEVSRDLPNGAHISIVERLPWGVWQAAGQTYVIDGEGVILDMAPPAGAPIIVQTDLPAEPLAPGDRVDEGAVAVARELVSNAEQTVGRRVLSLEFSQASGLIASLSGDLRVAFGDAQGYDFKLAALFAVLERAQNEGRTVQRVDLRFGDRVAVQ
jgi:cell division protein FtsQ